VLKDIAGVELPPAARKTIDLERRVVKDAVREALKDRQAAMTGFVHAVRQYRRLVDKPLTLRGAEDRPKANQPVIPRSLSQPKKSRNKSLYYPPTGL
jgi:hypothetical protein